VMLGHFPGWSYTSVERRFQPGDRLILYTDGMIEATNTRDEFFDLERLKAFAGADGAQDAESFVDALISHVRTWRGGLEPRGFDDDVTLVVVDCVARLVTPGTDTPLAESAVCMRRASPRAVARDASEGW